MLTCYALRTGIVNILELVMGRHQCAFKSERYGSVCIVSVYLK